MRWRRYHGYRIDKPGMRTLLEDPRAYEQFWPDKYYGCVWEQDGQFHGYYEVPEPGQLDDAAVGPFSTEAEARRAVEAGLLASRSERVGYRM